MTSKNWIVSEWNPNKLLLNSVANRETKFSSVQFSSVAQSCPTLCDAMNRARQASLSITISPSSLKLTSIESVMPSSYLILCHPLFLLPPIPPSTRVFSNESTLRMRWPKYWSLSFSIIPWKMAMTTLYARQEKRHRCVYRTFGLRGRGRGWDDLGEREF